MDKEHENGQVKLLANKDKRQSQKTLAKDNKKIWLEWRRAKKIRE